MERINKDLEHFDDINDGSHTENLDTFKHCLEQDYLVMSEFNEALRQFGTTIATYQQNLQWVNTFMERDLIGYKILEVYIKGRNIKT